MITILIYIQVAIKIFSLSLLTSALLITNVYADSAIDETQIERVEIKGSKQGVTLVELPASATVISSETIEIAGITRLTDIEKFVPNLKFSEFGEVGTRFISIRGVGANPLSENRIAVYIDDIPFRTINDKLLTDISQIEVLRGPQGTLYGANTEGGVIVINTKSPIGDSRTNISMSSEYYDKGNRQSFTFSNVLPLSDNWALRTVLHNENGDSYTQNIDPNTENPGEINDTAFLASLHYDDGEKTLFSLHAMANFDRAKGIYEQNYIPIQATPYNDIYATHNPALLMMWGIDQANEKAIAEQHEYHMDDERYFDETERVLGIKYGYDFDWADMLFVSSYLNKESTGVGAQFELSSLPVLNSGGSDLREQVFAELRFSGEINNINWLFGASWYHGDREFTVITKDLLIGEQAFVDTPTLYETHLDYALFTNIQWQINTDWQADFGLRADNAKREMQRKEIGVMTLGGQPAAFFPTVDEEADFNDLLPKLSLSYQINSHSKAYFNIAKGWQPGGLNDDAFVSDEAKELGIKYDKEQIVSAELGVKGMLTEHSVYWSAAVFNSNAKDWHEMNFLRDASGRAASTATVINAGKLKSSGAEFEFEWLYSDNLTFAGHLAYTNSEYKEFSFGENTDFTGNSSILMPKNSASLRSIYQLNDQWKFMLQLNHFGDMPLDLDNKITQESYQLTDISVQWQHEQLSIRAYVNNVFDEYYFSGQAFYDFTMPVDDVTFSAPGRPRYFGVSVSYSFN